MERRGAVPWMRFILILAGLNALAALLAAIPAAAQPTGMGNDPEYWAFIQELKRARAMACGAEGAAIAEALRKKDIHAEVQGIEKDDPSPRVVISIGVFEPTPITPELVDSLPKEIAGFPVVVERPCCFFCGGVHLESSRRALK
jgi:hypothetical protein